MKEILNLSMGSSTENFDETFELLGEKIRIKRLGVDFNFSLLKKLLLRHEHQFDVISVTGLPSPVSINGKTYEHHQVKEVMGLTEVTPVVDGRHVRDTYMPWAINFLNSQYPELFRGKSVGFFLGSSQLQTIRELESIDCQLEFADPFFLLKAPYLIKNRTALEKFFAFNFPILNKRRIRKFRNRDFTHPSLKYIPSFKAFLGCDIYILNNSQVHYLKLPELIGKIVIVDYLTDDVLEKLKEASPKAILSCAIANKDLPIYGTSLMEGIFQALKDEPTPLTQVEILEFIEDLNIRPQQETFEQDSQTQPSKFGFVVHPLSVDHLFKHPLLKSLRRFDSVKNLSEKAMGTLPGFHYGRVKGIKSKATGKEVIGEIYAISETPKMMMSVPKEKIYKKLVCLTKQAKVNGCKLFGLGAYTKIVGDAGVTINERSPLPVTTGNSLSAASTLWAASYAIDKMGFVKKEGDVYKGCAMVVGATGSIGKVSSMLLSKGWEKIILIAPRPYKLIDLADKIKSEYKNCEVIYATDPTGYLPEADLIITTTSAQGRKILDIEKVRPGCVICDVSRPFDISAEDAAKRPDVLVMASGEVELPGEVEVTCDIGLEGQVVYACLAETALLALEGRYETFSLSRDISYKKVIEIDRLARKHGVKLSAIMGHSSEITSEEIDLAREKAIKKRNDV
ncbi:MAG: hypothetical protein KC478_14095 [Bacteriovoracaceae bacterium]|nr:hypothetical protein [Bacteriovoracaceae bacterium]